MKKKTAINIVSALLLVIAAITSTKAAEPQCDTQIVFRVERGDTFSNLFVDWQKAFDQNRTTVIRRGKPVTSPDILVEGSILRVTCDVHLTARAIARVDTLVKRRAALRHRLTVLLAKTTGPSALHVAEFRRMLDYDLRYVGDVDFIEHEIAKLEIVDDRPAPGPSRSTSVWPIAGLCGAAIFLVWFALRRRRTEGPGGDERIRSVLNDFDQSLHAPPLDH